MCGGTGFQKQQVEGAPCQQVLFPGLGLLILLGCIWLEGKLLYLLRFDQQGGRWLSGTVVWHRVRGVWELSEPSASSPHTRLAASGFRF